MIKQKKGITLIALIIAIIILIILAGVSINTITGENGIINKAERSALLYNDSKVKEQEDITFTETYFEKGTYGAPIPSGYEVSQIPGESTVNEGMVIYQIPTGAEVDWQNKKITINGVTTNLQETVNQYVWIPVSDINEMVMCKQNGNVGLDGTSTICNLVLKDNRILECTTHGYKTTDSLTTENIDTTGLAGRLYNYSVLQSEMIEEIGNNKIFKKDIDFTIKTQKFGINEELREPDILTNKTYADGNDSYLTQIGLVASNGKTLQQVFKEKLNNDFIEMAICVAKNKGFYVSRYEMGIGGVSKKKVKVLTTSTSKTTYQEGLTNWYGMYKFLEEENVDVGENVNSYMIWGCQYEQMIKFLGNDALVGHAFEANFNSNLSAPAEEDIFKNIYDLQENYFEITMTAVNKDGRALRGGPTRSANGEWIPRQPIALLHYRNPKWDMDCDAARIVLNLK